MSVKNATFAANPAGDLGDVFVVRVQHDPAVRLRDAGHDGLDLGQLGQRVDALHVHVVRRDVGDHARLVALVAHARRRMPPRAVSRTAMSRSPRSRMALRRPVPSSRRARPSPPDHDPVRCRRPDPPARLAQDVGDQPGRRGLAVRAGDRHDRQAPIRVANPGRPSPRRPRCGRRSARGGVAGAA